MKKKSSLLMADVLDYEAMVKNAFLMGLMKNVGKVMMKRPVATGLTGLTVASNAMDMGNAASRVGGAASRSRNLMKQVANPPINM